MNTIDNNNDIQSRILATRAGLAGGVGGVGGIPANKVGHDGAQVQGLSFGDIFKAKTREVSFSAHASSRLQSRGIEVTPEVMEKLEKAVDGAQGKGARDSLIIVKDLAFIVNIPNRTVITAMDGSSMKDNIFTNIDSAVIAS